jgi:hypothetical protein
MHVFTVTMDKKLTIWDLNQMSIPFEGNHPKRPNDYDPKKASENTIWLHEKTRELLEDHEVWSIDISPKKNVSPADLLKLIPVATSMISSIVIPKHCRQGKRLQTYFAIENGDGVATTDHLHGIILVKPNMGFHAKQNHVISKLKKLTLIPDKSRSVRVGKVVSSENLSRHSDLRRLLKQFHYMSKQTNNYRDPLAQYKNE